VIALCTAIKLPLQILYHILLVMSVIVSVVLGILIDVVNRFQLFPVLFCFRILFFLLVYSHFLSNLSLKKAVKIQDLDINPPKKDQAFSFKFYFLLTLLLLHSMRDKRPSQILLSFPNHSLIPCHLLPTLHLILPGLPHIRLFLN